MMIGTEKRIRFYCKRIAKNITRHWPYLVIFFVAIFLTLPNLHKDGIPYGSGANDTIFHMIRMSGASVRGFKDDQAIPQIDPAGVGGMGIGINLFYGPMLTYLLPILRLILFNWNYAYITLIFIFILLAGLFLYKLVLEISKNKTLSCVASILYMTAPYFLSDIYIRGAWGEIPTFTFMPMLFLGLQRVLNNKKWGTTFLWVSATGIILNHMLSIVIVFPFALAYLLSNFRIIHKRQIKNIIIAIVITLGLTSFFWLPFLELKFTGLYNIFNTPYLGGIPANGADEVYNNGLAITQYIFTDPLLGSNGVTQYNLSFPTIIGIAAFFTIRKRIQQSQRRTLARFSVIGIVALLLSLRSILWLHIPESLLNIQFPWRFCIITTMCFSILGAYGIYYALVNLATISKCKSVEAKSSLNKIIIYIVVAFAIFTTMPILSTVYYSYPHTRFEYISHTNQADNYFNKAATREYMPVVPCADPENDNTCSWDILSDKDLRRPQIISGEANLESFQKHGTKATLNADILSDNTIIQLPYIYYPGYSITAKNTATNESTKLETRHSPSYGLITVLISSKGHYEITIRYSLTTPSLIGAFITILTVLSLVAIGTIRKTRKQHNHPITQ